jgi:hypothetical protein
VRDLAQEKGVGFRTAAYAIALQRVADAERLRGQGASPPASNLRGLPSRSMQPDRMGERLR